VENGATKRRLRGPARRATVLNSAASVFAARGYATTSMAEIAESAGVTRAVLYDHFASKKAIYLAVLGEQSALFLGHVGAAIALEARPGMRMRRTMESVFAFADRYPHSWRVLYANSRNGDPEIDAAWQEAWDARVSEVGRLLADDLSQAGMEPGDARSRVVVEMLVGALTAAVENGRLRRGDSREDLLEAGTALLWVGLRHIGQD
jgi:AcrR family transcriptional regulator